MKWTRLIPVLLLGAACAPAAEPPPDEVAAPAPASTDIWLYSLESGEPVQRARVTDRDGYDNQPYFTPDGNVMLFTSDREGQNDVFAATLAGGMVIRITDTADGEYSPTMLPEDGRWFSAIRMDSAGVQELWQYTLDATAEPRRVALIDRVGYHTWVDRDRILFFRLGNPNSLQVVRAGTADTTVVARRVGRSLHRIPGERASSFLLTLEDGTREIRRYDWDTGATEAIAVPLEGQQDYAWTTDGALLMAVGSELYRYAPGQDADWVLLGDLGLSNVSRLAVGPGQLLAVVAERTP